MLNPLRAPPVRKPLHPVTADPIGGMLECHDRIRRFLDGLARLVALEDLHDPRAPDAATACARYFREGLPLHGLDEDLSLAPRLRAFGNADVDAALDCMAAEHAMLDRGLPLVLADLDTLAAGAPVPRKELVARQEWLDALLRGHIELEERVVFPFAREALDDRQRTDIAAEMRARRA